MTTQLLTKTLYDEDYYLWLETMVKQLQMKDLEHLDWEHLIEEMQALGNEQKHKVKSYLRQLLKHLLLYQFWDLSDCKNHWEGEIDNFRAELKDLLQSKTLYNYLVSILDDIYIDALRQARKKSGLKVFPEICPYTVEQILDLDFLP